MSRKAESIPTLAAQGLLRGGTRLEVVPEFLPRGARRGDRRFTATVVSARGRQGSIRWDYDGCCYSLTTLTRMINTRYGIQWPGKTCANWQLVGDIISLWELAERFER